jgi:NAD(P)H-hydrate epimerase
MDKVALTRVLHRAPDSHKYNFGHVLIIGGSPGMVGAPLLSGKAALRSGAGLVTIASEQTVIDKLEGRVEELMTLALPKASGEADAVLQKFIIERKVTVLVLGPGLKPTLQIGNFIEKLIEQLSIPMVIDGGALSVLGSRLDELQKASSSTIILTPHLGEFKRLVDIDIPDKRSGLKPIAARFAEGYNVHLVLKGHPTYVAHPNGSVYENKTGNPGLATAGTGDVLTGLIAAFIAQGVYAQQAIEMAVHFHGLAGDIAAKEKTEPGMIASDVIESIPAALKRFDS